MKTKLDGIGVRLQTENFIRKHILSRTLTLRYRSRDDQRGSRDYLPATNRSAVEVKVNGCRVGKIL